MVAAVTSLSKDKIRILLLEGIHASAVVNLARAGYQKVEQLKGALDRDTLLEKVSQAHMVGIRSRTQLDAEVLEAARRLMAIGCFCIGTNQVDLKAALNLGIPVFNAPFSNTRSVAELVLAEAILLLRGIPEKSLTRSAASTTRSYSRLGRLISRSKMSGLAWFPMARRSPNPSVTTSADRAPSRSSSAFVATVVPMRIHSMRSVGTGASRGIVSPVTSSRMRRIPSLGALS